MPENATHFEVTLVEREKNAPSRGKYAFFNEADAIAMPFCSHDLFLKGYLTNILRHFFEEAVFLRQQHISQLENLTPPGSAQKTFYFFPVFKHKRYDHAKMVAMMAAWMVVKWGFTWEEALTFVLAAAFHDAPTVAGGDAIRCAFDELCEERNFLECLQRHGIDLKWQKRGADPLEAQRHVDGRGKYAKHLECLDRISYTILDVYFLGGDTPDVLRKLLGRYRSFGDVWLDLCLDEQGRVYFNNAERLYVFLLVRALMHVHLYKNPASRRIEHIVAKETRQLLKEGIISFEDLKREDDRWLSKVLEQNGCQIRRYMTPDIVNWKRFTEESACLAYAQKLGTRLVLTEQIKPFNPGLDYLTVGKAKKILPLEQVLAKEKVLQLRDLAREREGWYVYYYAHD